MLKIVGLEDFITEVNDIIGKEGCSVIEAVCQYAEDHDINYEALVPYINQSFKPAIQAEAERLNLIKKEEGQLPF